jgi:terminase large subunit-like protein
MPQVQQAEQRIIWQPQPGPQTMLIQCPVFEVFFGGARGGGKTDGSIGDWLEHSSTYGRDAVGVFFRRKFKQLEEVVARTKYIFPLLGAKYNEQQAQWTMQNGARLKFRYIEHDKDAEEYQGHSYTRVYIEEATNFPNPGPINLLRGTLRSGAGAHCGMRLTGNPGGPGHAWVKARYIDPAPGGFKVIVEMMKGLEDDSVEIPMERVFIPSRISDNKILMQSDASYVARLRQVGKAALVEAWLKGDWNIIDGAFFDEFDQERHILIPNFIGRIPPKALRYRAFDWGSFRPFSCGWYAVSNGEWGLPVGALLKYREWYGASAPNVGLKMDASLVAQGIVEREEGETIHHGVADPSIFKRDGGPSIAEMMAIKRCNWYRADNSRKTGWEQLRHRLVGENGTPMIYFLETCVDTIRTLPALQHDPHDSEDVDTDGEDHAGDETRYAVMSRPWTPDMKTVSVPFTLNKPRTEMTVNELMANHKDRRRLRSEADA